jgi:hypothetical protein
VLALPDMLMMPPPSAWRELPRNSVNAKFRENLFHALR